jgi:hypothetical protein
MVKYHVRTFEFTPLAVQMGAVNVSLGGIKTHVEKIEEVGRLTILLDTYQYMLCVGARALSKRRQQKYIEVQLGAIGVLTSLHGSLLAFQADPIGQTQRLDDAVGVMQNFMDKIARQSLRFLAPSTKVSKQIAEGRAAIRGSVPQSTTQLNQEKIGALINTWARAPPMKAGKPLSPPTLARLLRTKAMSDALSFAGLERSQVKELAKELARK